MQSAWESYCSELFDYKKLLGEINSQPSVHIGSSQKVIPDIFLKIDDKDVLDIELKKYSLSFDSSFQEQLISYLKLTNICVGMIVCNEIRVYYYDYSKNKTEFTSVSFTKDNPDGIQLVELIEKENFSNEKIKKF
ncbi:MAG: type I restriction enzyme HsdR N-terminal domain-containing protein, partial [Clostridia bacterium]|nr:type I restriction enzyme HsdR N-terminal domain-containing protein [Clostridia bacterium]